MVRILHFSDAHIDTVRQGRHDPQSGLPVRTLDFLQALDIIVDTAIAQKAELAIFAGDAYRNQLPAPTFQREWGKRILRLSQAGIFTILVVGNHDVSPATGRAHALQEFETLRIPNTCVISEPCLLTPKDLNGLPLQIIGLPWISRSGLMAYTEARGKSLKDVQVEIEDLLSDALKDLLNQLDPALPAILTAHLTVQGAVYGNERSVMLGRDLTIPPGLLKDEKLDYVALGHIHRFQDLNKGQYPPIVYAGSIEKMDFGEMRDAKGFVLADVERKKTSYTFHPLSGRKFLSSDIEVTDQDAITDTIIKKMPSRDSLKDAIFRLNLFYPSKWEVLIDEHAIRDHAEDAFEFYLVRNPSRDVRVQLSEDMRLGQMAPLDVMDVYWKSNHVDEVQAGELRRLATTIMQSCERNESVDAFLEKLEKGSGEA
ncbi:MAG: exonuclease SbcCD subunit D [Pelolinea sp.]|jgi:exonuclease SbcD|nr:exonuclease SbcCD subunit D [Pelolinea sp.]